MKAEIQTVENSAGQKTRFLQQINYKKNESTGGECYGQNVCVP